MKINKGQKQAVSIFQAIAERLAEKRYGRKIEGAGYTVARYI